ncbi:MAG: Heparinase II/III-like protein [Alistipes senegalensis]|nr:Heparinase II/III-like protein [Alistipes senegalensis]
MKHCLRKASLYLLLACTYCGLHACADDDPETVPAFREESDDVSPDPAGTFDYALLRKAEHPRLLMNGADFEGLKQRIVSESDSELRRMHYIIMKHCNAMLISETADLAYTFDAAGRRLLSQSRKALLRIFLASYAYRMTGRGLYLEKVEHDMNVVCDFPDWNHARHFLDVGEMALAVAIGYDWCYRELSPETRSKAHRALVKYALEPSRNFHNETNNWNQVCYGGLTAAALVTYEKNVSIAAEVIEQAVASNRRAMQAIYAPDGNTPEGYAYWSYGTTYQVALISMLEKLFGNDGGLSQTAGFKSTARYILYMEGPNGLCYNYSDCINRKTQPMLPMWWFAAKSGDASLLHNEMRKLEEGGYEESFEELRLLPLVMTCLSGIDLNDVRVPADDLWYGEGTTPVILVHTGWKWNASDCYLGIKGGCGKTSHGHLDAGSFVFDAKGYRWAMDLGMTGYSTIEKMLAELGGNLFDVGQNSLRWSVFRLKNESHSTITVNGARHRVDGYAKLLGGIDNGRELGGTFDMTPVVSDQTVQAIRTVKLVDNSRLVVVDRITALASKSAAVRWGMVTPASCDDLNDRENYALLRQGTQTMYLCPSVDSEDIALTMKIWSTAGENPWDTPNTGTGIVGFEAVIPAGETAVFTTTLSELRP